jgi:hypothetical protein
MEYDVDDKFVDVQIPEAEIATPKSPPSRSRRRFRTPY